MNKIISGLMSDFRAAQNIDADWIDSVAFEYFVTDLVVGAISETSAKTAHTVVGDNQIAVDAIAILANGTLIENWDEIDTLISLNNYLDVDFVFLQAKTSEAFDVSVLGALGDFAIDFIELDECETDTNQTKKFRLIKNQLYEESKYFKRRNPNVHIYYVTTGIKPESDRNFLQKMARIKQIFADKSNTGDCGVTLVGAREIQELQRQMDNSIEREIEFSRKVPLPQSEGIDEAYLGIVSAPTFIDLLRGQSGNMLSSIFYDNVRDWQGDNSVNSGMAATLNHPVEKSRFMFMNNGVTIIARKIRSTGEKILLEDYQIVNGCQTSNVLWNNRGSLDATVFIPLKIVATTDEKVVTDIIRATNSQTEVTTSQLLAATDFQKQLEQYFQTLTNIPLYYERRSKQFTKSSIDRASILTPIGLMKAYASMILEEPHKTTRDFQSIVSRAGSSIFGAKHKLELYYMAALSQYWIDQLLRKALIDRSLTVARFQILLAFKLLNQSEGMPPVESGKAKSWANSLVEKLQDQTISQASFKAPSELVAHLLEPKKNKSDAARSASFTEEVISAAKAMRLKNQS